MTHFEIESLPSGAWGYYHFSRMARMQSHWGKPWLGMTGRFQKSWGDFGGIKPQAALEYECFRAQALGGGNSVGDQLPRGGALDLAAYDLIGAVYALCAEAEPFYAGSTAVTQVGVYSASWPGINGGKSEEGAVQMCENRTTTARCSTRSFPRPGWTYSSFLTAPWFPRRCRHDCACFTPAAASSSSRITAASIQGGNSPWISCRSNFTVKWKSTRHTGARGLSLRRDGPRRPRSLRAGSERPGRGNDGPGGSRAPLLQTQRHPLFLPRADAAGRRARGISGGAGRGTFRPISRTRFSASTGRPATSPRGMAGGWRWSG